MKRFSLLLTFVLACAVAEPRVWAQAGNPPAPTADTSQQAAPAAQPAPQAAEQQAKTTAAAAVTATHQVPRAPDFLEHLVDAILEVFNVRTSGNTPTRYAIAAALLLGAFMLRRAVTGVIFNALKKVATRTQTTFDDKLFPALEAPVATMISLAGMFAALKVLKLSRVTDNTIGYASTVAFSLVLLWGVLRAFNAVLDHAREVALQRQLGIAAFMPWIKKTLLAIAGVFGTLLIIQSLGYDVKTLLAGLGLGGLAFALAAQDTLSNVFGSIVVATDQPFKIGEFVQIGAHVGAVEDIGLRSTKLRRPDKALVVIPNKTVAGESIINLARVTQRRIEQVLLLSYDSKPEQIEGLVEEIRRLILAEPVVDAGSVLVFFRGFSASSLDIFLAFMTKDADGGKAVQLQQRLNLAFMRAVEARGLSFAPTQKVALDGAVAKKIVEQAAPPSPAAG